MNEDDELDKLLDEVEAEENQEESLDDNSISVEDVTSIETDIEAKEENHKKSKKKLSVEDRYKDTVEELIENYHSDREDLEEFAQILFGKIRNTANGKDASKTIYETLAQVLRSKSETNTNLVKVMDSLNRRLEKSNSAQEKFARMLEDDGLDEEDDDE